MSRALVSALLLFALQVAALWVSSPTPAEAAAYATEGGRVQVLEYKEAQQKTEEPNAASPDKGAGRNYATLAFILDGQLIREEGTDLELLREKVALPLEEALLDERYVWAKGELGNGIIYLKQIRMNLYGRTVEVRDTDEDDEQHDAVTTRRPSPMYPRPDKLRLDELVERSSRQDGRLVEVIGGKVSSSEFAHNGTEGVLEMSLRRRGKEITCYDRGDNIGDISVASVLAQLAMQQGTELTVIGTWDHENQTLLLRRVEFYYGVDQYEVDTNVSYQISKEESLKPSDFEMAYEITRAAPRTAIIHTYKYRYGWYPDDDGRWIRWGGFHHPRKTPSPTPPPPKKDPPPPPKKEPPPTPKQTTVEDVMHREHTPPAKKELEPRTHTPEKPKGEPPKPTPIPSPSPAPASASPSRRPPFQQDGT